MGTNITGIGNANAIGFKSRVTGGIYFPPELKDALVGVWSAYGKSNDSTDRNIIKNKIKDRGGDFVISNAAFKLNSGFGKYETDFTTWIQTNGVIASSDKVQNSIVGRFLYFNAVNKKEDVPSFKVNITLGQQSKLQYNYIKEDGTSTYIVYSESGIYTIPASYFSKYTGGNAWFGFYQIEGTSIIEQIPSFEGAFVTDGINDLITSTKTVQEMLGGSNEITVVSMMANLDSRQILCNSNFSNTNGYNVRNTLEPNGVISMLGYTDKNGTTNNLNLIMGDKDSIKLTDKVNFNSDYVFYPAQYYKSYYQVAWYWTIIANKVLTTDQINQVIAYFNLDRTLKPDILCDVKKQGITNDNHAEFGDKLIDFSGNGRDIQLNNIAWKLDSGIGKYETDLSDTRIWTQSKEITSSPFSFSYNGLSGWILFANTELTCSTDIPSFKIQIKGLLEGQELIYRYYDSNGQSNVYSMGKDGEYTLPSDVRTAKPQTSNTSGFQVVKNEANIITITQIPSHAGALCLDGVNDFGKVTGMPIYKDYTIVVDYERISGIEQAWAEALISKSPNANNGAFILMETNGMAKHSYSFGAYTTFNKDDSTRTLLYQSKYKCGDVGLNAGTGVDGDTLWLGTYRDNYNSFFNGAIYSLMSFPYSMSEFLIERQLKKHKLGTLYPDMVEFRPIVKSNSEYLTIGYLNYSHNLATIKVGDYISIGDTVAIRVILGNVVDEVVNCKVNGQECEIVNVSPKVFDGKFTITSKSPQKINITIDEYIRFEDIVQPYPVLLRFKDESGNEVSWGGKFRVGSTITRIGSIADPERNLLNGLYSISGLSLNGKAVTSSTSIVEKQMVFRTTATWLLDDNEPKVILSPSRLRIPNSSYKLLGYIPDISGHGNHGKINNSAYAGASGANGYPYDYNNSSFWSDSVLAKVVSGELIEYFAVKNSAGFSNITSGVYKGEIKVTGVTKAISENKISQLIIYTNSTTDNELIDITQDGNYNIDIKGVGDANRVFFYAIPNNPNESIVVRLTEPIYIEQVGEYEGAYCLDGVDDSITIPTLSSGGKQVLMKVNWNSLNHVLYDQRNNAEAPFCIVTASGSIAYNQRNVGGNTYIDGILNNHILVADLQAITHNIVLNNDYNVANSNSFIGTNYTKSIYAQMSLYDFMLFDEISTDDKIKELNEYVGIEAKVELPPYYWDAYGKTNLDADKATIQQRGVAVGDYDLTNNNHAYDKMSGYGGYKFAKFDNTIEWFAEDSSMVVNRNGYLITLKKVPNVAFWRFRNTTLKSLDNPLTFKVKCNKPIDVIFQVKFAKNNDVSIGYNYNIKEVTLVPNESTTIIVPSVSVSDIPEATSILFINVLFNNTSLSDNEEYTVEMLPLYPNGLVYDAITDYSENVNIPVFTDFTAIMKRKWLKNQGCPLIKGSKVYEGGNGNALLFEWDKAYNFVFYKRTDIMEGKVPENISFITPTNYNGNVITRGSGQDTNGICIAGDGNAGFANIVFYKLILYPKTIPLLQINFLKNLMERDEIIDLNNPIFIKNE